MEETEDEQLASTSSARRVFQRTTEQLALIPHRLGTFERTWVASAEARRLSFVNRRGEEVDAVRLMSRIVLVWTMTATVLSLFFVLLAASDRLPVVLVVLCILYGLGTRKRLARTRAGAESGAAVDKRRGLLLASLWSAVLIAGTLVVYERSSVLARLLAIAVLLGHAIYRYASWRLDLFVLSSTALWRFQGVLDFRVSSLEYTKIQAGPNATSGLAAWLPIGIISMDSAAQTGDLPMHRIGPVWGAEELAITIFHRRKGTGQRVRVVNPEDFRTDFDAKQGPAPTVNDAVRRRRPKAFHTTPPSKRRHP